MRRRHAVVLATTVALCALATGCAKTYRAETVLHADGSVDRAIYQPADETPEPARQAKLWKQTTFAVNPDDMERKGWPDALTALPAQAQDEKHPYFAAWNHFASVKDLPETVLFKSPVGSGLPDGKLERELTQNDLGLVVEFRWRETLTDVTNLLEMHKAREELTDGAVKFGQEVFTEAVGKEYDPSDLVQWMKTEGKDWFNETTDLLFMSAAAKDSAAARRQEDALTASMERRGLKLKKDGEWLKGEDMNHAVQDFIINLVAQKVKKDGKPVGQDVARKWLEELNSKDGGRWQTAGQKVIAMKYGGEAAFKSRIEALSVRIFGRYTFGDPLDFQYTMTFPGAVVETNGEFLGSGDKVRWHFHGADAFPLGYSMEARALLVPEDARKLLGREKPLSDRDSQTAYADLVGGDKPLAAVMCRCRKEKTVDPLYEYLTGQKASDAAAAARVEKVLKLLKAS